MDYFMWKLQKLRRCVDEMIPDDGKLISKDVKIGLLALDIMNRMESDYILPHQTNINFEIDANEDEVRKVVRELETI